MAATRTVKKKPATRRPTPAHVERKVAPRPPALHGFLALVDRTLELTEHIAVRIAVMVKRGRKSLLRHA